MLRINPRWMVALVLALVATAPAFAYCPGTDPDWPGSSPDYYSVPKEFARATFVVQVKVQAVTWLDEGGKPTKLKPPFSSGGPLPLGFDPYIGVRYQVKVVTAYKGSPSPELRLFSENSTARFILNQGGEYLLFVTNGVFDPPIRKAKTVDNCGNSETWSPASKALELVEKLSAHKGAKP